MFAPWENTSLHFMTIESESEELNCIECKMSILTWKMENPCDQTGPTLCFYCEDQGDNERMFSHSGNPPFVVRYVCCCCLKVLWS